MPSIQSLNKPLVFKARQPASAAKDVDRPAEAKREIHLRAKVRCLEGMQKEAIVCVDHGAGTWRMVSDEGPYLNGTDLAPFPLGFFSAGMQFSFLSGLLGAAAALDVRLQSLSLAQDNFYTMEGSFVRADALGGAIPAKAHVTIRANVSAETAASIIATARATCPAHALMRDVLRNTFSLKLNGKDLPTGDVNPSPRQDVPDPADEFNSIEQEADSEFLPEIISKTSSAEKIAGVEGGAGSSLKAEQKRTLHVHGDAQVRPDMVMETEIRLFKPIGSSFRFLCDQPADSGGKGVAPPPAAYVSAGVSFCFLTQLSRYAQIVEQNLRAVRIVQDNGFRVTRAADGTAAVSAAPFDTHVFVESDEPPEAVGRLLRVGERTCFLHAAMRGSYPTEVTAELNGKPLAIA